MKCNWQKKRFLILYFYIFFLFSFVFPDTNYSMFLSSENISFLVKKWWKSWRKLQSFFKLIISLSLTLTLLHIFKLKLWCQEFVQLTYFDSFLPRKMLIYRQDNIYNVRDFYLLMSLPNLKNCIGTLYLCVQLYVNYCKYKKQSFRFYLIFNKFGKLLMNNKFYRTN